MKNNLCTLAVSIIVGMLILMSVFYVDLRTEREMLRTKIEYLQPKVKSLQKEVVYMREYSTMLAVRVGEQVLPSTERVEISFNKPDFGQVLLRDKLSGDTLITGIHSLLERENEFNGSSSPDKIWHQIMYGYHISYDGRIARDLPLVTLLQDVE